MFARADLDRPFVTHNAELLATLAPQLDAELVAGARVERDRRRRSRASSSGCWPAGGRGSGTSRRSSGLSARTLQRRLADDGASFQQLVQEARRELARHYLLHSSLELNETAYLLGYEDAHSFFRAFHGWEGSPPGEWRARHAQAG